MKPPRSPMDDAHTDAAGRVADAAGNLSKGGGIVSIIFGGWTAQELGVLVGVIGVIAPMLLQYWFYRKRLRLQERQVEGEEHERERREDERQHRMHHREQGGLDD